MTQKELARQVGVSRQTMNTIENGRHTPTIAVAIRIADVFRVSVDQLFELDYEGKPANREQAPRFAADPLPSSAEAVPSIENIHEPAKQKPASEISLASLRNVVG